MRKLSRKDLIVFSLIFIFSIQGWHSLNYVTSCYTSGISNLTISSDDPFFGDEPISADKNVTLHLTDQFSIKGLAHKYIGRVFQTQIHLKIFDPNEKLTYSEMKYLPHKRKVNFEFNNIALSPNLFKVTGMYRVKLYLTFNWGGIIKVSKINTTYFKLEREIVDLSCYFIDNIYFQTETTPYHHEIYIYGSAEEAGEPENLLINENVKLYWTEPNGTDTLVGKFSTNEFGSFNTSISRKHVLHYNYMNCYLKFEETPTYQPADSRYPSQFLMKEEGNTHIIKNANEAGISDFDVPESYGFPSRITLSNKEHSIWSPNGDDNDIENWNFRINPFGNPELNTIGYNGENTFDGYDYWISNTNGIIKNQSGFQMIDSSYRNKIIPFDVEILSGSISVEQNLNDLVINNNEGIRFCPEEMTSLNLTFYESKIRYLFSSNFSQNQIENLKLAYYFNVNDIQELKSFSITLFDGIHSIDLIENSNKSLDLAKIIDITQYNLDISRFYLEVFFNYNKLIGEESLCDVLYLELNPIDSSSNILKWNDVEGTNNKSISFQSIGGLEDDIITYHLASEVYIPDVPFYNFENSIFSISLTCEKLGIFEIELGLNITLAESEQNFLIPLWNSFPENRIDDKLFLSYDITSLIKDLQEKLFYLGFYAKLDGLELGEDFICDLLDITLTADFLRKENSPSVIEHYNEDFEYSEEIYYPYEVDYDFAATELFLNNNINETLDYMWGSTYQHYMENINDSYLINNGNIQIKDTNNDLIDDYILNPSQINVPFDPLPEIIALKDNLSVEATGDISKEVFLANDNLNQSFYFRHNNGSIVHTVTISNSLYEFSINQSNQIHKNNYSVLDPLSYIIISLPVNREIRNIDLSSGIMARLEFLRGNLAPKAVVTQEIYNLNLQYIDEINFSNYNYFDYNPVANFDIKRFTIQFEANDNSTKEEININNEYIHAIGNNRDFITFRLYFNPDDYIDSNTTIFLADYDYLKFLNRTTDLIQNYFIENTFYELNYYPKFEVIYTIISDDFSKLQDPNIFYTLSLAKGALTIFIMTPEGDLPIKYFNSLDFVQEIGSFSVNSDDFYGYNEISLKFSYEGALIYERYQNGFVLDELKIKYYKLNTDFNFHPYSKSYEGYMLYLDGTISNSSNLYGIIGIDNNVSLFSLIDLSRQQFPNYDPFSHLLRLDLTNPCFDNAYDINTEIISLQPFEITFSNISLFGGWHELSIYKEEKASLLTFFDFGAIISLNYIELYYELISGSDQAVEIVKISTLIQPTKEWDNIFDCQGKGTKVTQGWRIKFKEDLNYGDEVYARIIRVEFKIIRGNDFPEKAPIVQSAMISALRTKVGDLEGIKQYNDDNELIFGFVDETEKSIAFSFKIDIPSEIKPFMILSQDYANYPEFCDFPGLLLEDYSVKISHPSKKIAKSLDIGQRFNPELDGIIIEDIKQYLNDSGCFNLIFYIKTDFEINYHFDFLAASYYNNISSLMGLPQIFRMDLERASEIIEVSPSDADYWSGLGSYDLNAATNTASSTFLSYNTNGDDAPITLSRTMSEFFGRDIKSSDNDYNDRIKIFTGQDRIDNLVFPNLISIRYPSQKSSSIKSTSYSDIRIFGITLYRKYQAVGNNGEQQLSLTYDLSSLYNSYPDSIIKVRARIGAYSYYERTSLFGIKRSMTTSTSLELSVSSDKYSGTNIITKEFLLKSDDKITITTKKYYGWWDRFWWPVRYQVLKVYDLRVMVIKKDHIIGDLECESTLQINTGTSIDEIDSAVLSGSLEVIAGEYFHNVYNSGPFKSNLEIKTLYYQSPSNQWLDLEFPNIHNYERNPYFKKQYTDFGIHKREFIFSNDLISGGYKFQLPDDIFYVFNGYATAKLKVIVTYQHDPRNPIPLPSNMLYADLDYYIRAQWKNIELRILFSDTRLLGDLSYSEHNFGFHFDISEQDIKEEFEEEFDPADAWYFGTYFDFSIYPHWANDPITKTTHFHDIDKLKFKMWLGVERYYNKSESSDTYIEEIELPIDYMEFQNLDLTKESFEVIFTESEDRAAVIDPNALRLGSPDVDNYFISKEGYDSKMMRFYVNITIKWTSAAQLNTRKWYDPYGWNTRKMITIKVYDLTIIDIMKKPEFYSEFRDIYCPISIPPSKNDIFDRITNIKIKFGGSLKLSSFEIYHTLSSTIGYQVVMMTQSGGIEILHKVLLKNSVSNQFEFIIDIPVFKLDDKNYIDLFIHFGVFDFYFLGLYDDTGYLNLRFDHISVEYLYSTGFSDSFSGNAYIDQVFEYNIGFDLDDANISSIIVKGDIDYSLQYITISSNGRISEYASDILPSLYIYNYYSNSYEPMICYMEQTNLFTFVIDKYDYNLDYYSKEGYMKFIIVLDGTSILDNIGFNEYYSYAHIFINSLEIEIKEEGEEKNQKVSFESIKPNGDILELENWAFYNDIYTNESIPYNFRYEIGIDEIPSEKQYLNVSLAFVNEYSNGILPNYYAILNKNNEIVEGQLINYLINNNSQIIFAEVIIIIDPNYNGNYYLYWSDLTNYDQWEMDVDLSNVNEFLGIIQTSNIQDYFNYNPYNFEVSKTLWKLNKLDSYLYSLYGINGAASHTFEFNFDNLIFDLNNITGIQFKLIEISEFTSNFYLRIFDFTNKIFKNYPIKTRTVDNFYFKEYEHKIATIHLDPLEIISYLARDLKLIVELGCETLEELDFEWEINTMEFIISYNEGLNNEINAEYKQYIADQNFLDSIEFYDIFSQTELDGWFGDINDFKVQNSYLTKYPPSHKKSWWEDDCDDDDHDDDPCRYSWRCQKPSYILVDNYDDDYYVDFLVNIQDICSHYKTAEWLVHANKIDQRCKTHYTGLLFQLHAYQSASHHANELHIWKKESWGNCWRFIDSINVPIHIDVDTWYKITTYVNKSYISVKINGSVIYSDYISLNIDSGYFGIRSSYYEQFFIDNVIISKEEFIGENIRDYFASIEVNISDNTHIKYGDSITSSFTNIPDNYNSSLKDHKLSLLVNSSDGWLIMDEMLSNQNGITEFKIDSIDLSTFDILGSHYTKYINYKLENDTREYFFIENFDKDLSKWTSNHINDFTIENGYLEKDGCFDRESFVVTNPEHPNNYTIAFDAMMNIDPSREKFDWIINSDDDFHNGYMYRLYSSTSNEYPNTLQLYQKKWDDDDDCYKILTEIEVNQEIFTGKWYHLEIDISEDTEKVYHRIRFNDEQIFSYEFTQDKYYHRDYFGFRIYNTNQSIIDNVQLYTGTYNIKAVELNPFTIENENLIKYKNVKYNDNGITRIQDMVIYQEPYILDINDISLGVNLNFSYLLNEFERYFDLESYYGLKLGILLPYDPIISSVEVSLLDTEDNKIQNVLNYGDLNEIYSNPNQHSVIINQTHMVKTDVTLSFLGLNDAKLSSARYLSIKANRLPIEYGEYSGKRVENLIGMCSIQLLKQINNYSISNFDFEQSSGNTIAIYYEGSGRFYSSLKILNNIVFERTSTKIEIFNGPYYSVNYGGNFKIPLRVLIEETKADVPYLSPIIYGSFVLLIEKKNKWLTYGFEKLNLTNYEREGFSYYICDIHPLLSAGFYDKVKLLWIGNGLFKPCESYSEDFNSLLVTPSKTNINLTLYNMQVRYGDPFEVSGEIKDENGDMLKDLNLITYLNNFTRNDFSYYEITNLGSYYTNYTSEQFLFTSYMYRDSFFNFTPIYDPLFAKFSYNVDYTNIFHILYKSSNKNIVLSISLEYNNSFSICKDIRITTLDKWIDLYIDTQPDDYPSGDYILTNYSIKILSLRDQEIEFCIKDIKLEHFTPIYLQINTPQGWRNLAVTTVEIKDLDTSEFKFKLFSDSENYILNNIFRTFLYDEPLYNNSLPSGDYLCRIYFPELNDFYQPSSDNFFLRINPLETAIYYQHDGNEEISKDGFYNKRTYEDTSIFALEQGKPYTFVDLGWTWGDNKTVNFMLSTKDSTGLNGLPNKPLWFQIGIVPNSYHGLDHRSYLADYYPMTRNIRTGEMLVNVHFIQDKYGRPILYDYYDLEKEARRFYGPLLWQVHWTNEVGIVAFNLSITYKLFNYLSRIFSTRDLPNIEKHLYIRVFYKNFFTWDDMILPINDKFHGNEPILCSFEENQRKEDFIFNSYDADIIKQELKNVIYYDGIYSSSYAEGYIDVSLEGLTLEGNYMEVTLTGGERDRLSFLCQLNETQRDELGNTVPEGKLLNNNWNMLGNDIVKAYFFIMNPSMTKVLVGARDSNPMPATIDPITGLISFEMSYQTAVMEAWENIIPGYYKVVCIVQESVYYKATSTYFTMLVKSPYTFNFAEPSTSYDFTLNFAEQSEVFVENMINDEIYSNFTYTNVYPTLNGTIWMDPSDYSDGATAIILINNFPVYKRIVYPNESYYVNIPLEVFANFEIFNITLRTYSNEKKLINYDIDDPWESTNIDDRIHFDLYITNATIDNPYEGRGLIDVNITNVVKNNVNFETYEGNSIVQLSHIVEDDINGTALKIKKSFTSIFGQYHHGLLLYPEGKEYITEVSVNLVEWDPSFKITEINELTESILPYQLKVGWQYNLEDNFLESVRKAQFNDPLNDSRVAEGIRIFTMKNFRTYLLFKHAYLPYEGFIEGKLFLSRQLGTTERLNISIVSIIGTTISKVLWSQEIDYTNSDLINFTFETFNIFQSEYQDIAVVIESLNIAAPIAVYLYDARIRGFEDILSVSTHLPYGRAALFSSNFLYYFLRNQNEIGLTSEDKEVLIRVEDRKEEQKLGFQSFFDLTEVLEIYENVEVDQFHHDPQDESSDNGYITPHSNEQRYLFSEDEDEGIFVRTQIFGMRNVKTTQCHCGYVVMYKTEDPNDPFDENIELKKRKVSFFVRPQKWSIKPQNLEITFNDINNRFNIFLDGDRIPIDQGVDSNYVNIEYSHAVDQSNDKIWNKCNFDEFDNNWNKSDLTDVLFDIYDHQCYFTTSHFERSGGSNICKHNVIDFYPDISDWSSFDLFQTEIQVNDSSIVKNIIIRIYDDLTGIHEKTFPIQGDFSPTFIKWDLTNLNAQNLLKNVQRVDLIINPDFYILADRELDKLDIYFETSGVVLQHKDNYIEFLVQFEGETEEILITPHLLRSVFETKSIISSFKINGQKEIEKIAIQGSSGMKMKLYSINIFQNRTISNPNGGIYSYVDHLYSMKFDMNMRNILDHNQIGSNIEPLMWYYKVNGCVIKPIIDESTEAVYSDFDNDGFYDQMDLYEDYNGGVYGDGVNDQHSIDYDLDGKFDEIFSKTFRNQISYDKETGARIEHREKIRIITKIEKYDEINTIITRTEDIFQVELRNNKPQPYIRLSRQSVYISNKQRPDIIITHVDAWRLNSGEDDYETHIIEVWNPEKQAYDEEYWHDWAKVIDITMLGDKSEEQYPLFKNIHGIWDRGFTKVPLNPAVPIAGSNEVNGRFFWVDSYNLTTHSRVWDMAFVLVNDSVNQFSGLKHRNSELCIAVIIDSNRDHVYQMENLDIEGEYYDQFLPLWMASPDNNLQEFLEKIAHDHSWNDWVENMLKPATLVKLVAELAITFFVSVIVTAIATAWLPGGALFIAGLIASFITFAIMQFVGPAIDQIFDPTGTAKNKVMESNQNVLMNEKVNIPKRIPVSQNNQKWNFIYYESRYPGYSLAVHGGFVPNKRIMNDPTLSGYKIWDGTYTISGKLFAIEPDAPEYKDAWDIIAAIISDPFGTIAYFLGFRQQIYYTFDHYFIQKDVLEHAYEETLQYDKDSKGALHVRIIPYFIDGRPTYLAVEDDHSILNRSQFCKEDTEVWEHIEKSFLLYYRKYQAFYESNPQVIIADTIVTVIKVFLTCLASWAGTGVGLKLGGKLNPGVIGSVGGKAGSNRVADTMINQYRNVNVAKLLARMLIVETSEEIIKDELIINGLLGGTIDSFLLRQGIDFKLELKIGDYSLSMRAGDLLEWGFGFFDSFNNYVDLYKGKLETDIETLKEKQDVGELDSDTYLTKLETKRTWAGRLSKIMNALTILNLLNIGEIVWNIGQAVVYYAKTDIESVVYHPKHDTIEKKADVDNKIKRRFFRELILRGGLSAGEIFKRLKKYAVEKEWIENNDQIFFKLKLKLRSGKELTITEDDKQDPMYWMDIGEIFTDYQFTGFSIADPQKEGLTPIKKSIGKTMFSGYDYNIDPEVTNKAELRTIFTEIVNNLEDIINTPKFAEKISQLIEEFPKLEKPIDNLITFIKSGTQLQDIIQATGSLKPEHQKIILNNFKKFGETILAILDAKGINVENPKIIEYLVRNLGYVRDVIQEGNKKTSLKKWQTVAGPKNFVTLLTQLIIMPDLGVKYLNHHGHLALLPALEKTTLAKENSVKGYITHLSGNSFEALNLMSIIDAMIGKGVSSQVKFTLPEGVEELFSGQPSDIMVWQLVGKVLQIIELDPKISLNEVQNMINGLEARATIDYNNLFYKFIRHVVRLHHLQNKGGEIVLGGKTYTIEPGTLDILPLAMGFLFAPEMKTADVEKPQDLLASFQWKEDGKGIFELSRNMEKKTDKGEIIMSGSFDIRYGTVIECDGDGNYKIINGYDENPIYHKKNGKESFKSDEVIGELEDRLKYVEENIKDQIIGNLKKVLENPELFSKGTLIMSGYLSNKVDGHNKGEAETMPVIFPLGYTNEKTTYLEATRTKAVLGAAKLMYDSTLVIYGMDPNNIPQKFRDTLIQSVRDRVNDQTLTLEHIINFPNPPP
ncbi:MAG: hypothetical protein ACFFCY_01765 [Promethearchaeota archaeon]